MDLYVFKTKNPLWSAYIILGHYISPTTDAPKDKYNN